MNHSHMCNVALHRGRWREVEGGGGRWREVEGGGGRWREVEGGGGRFGTRNIHLRVRICVHTVSMQDTAVSAQRSNAMAQVTLTGNSYKRHSQLYNKLHH